MVCDMASFISLSIQKFTENKPEIDAKLKKKKKKTLCLNRFFGSVSPCVNETENEAIEYRCKFGNRTVLFFFFLFYCSWLLLLKSI